MPESTLLIALARTLGSKKVPIAGIAIIVAGYVATTVAPEGSEKNAAIASSSGVLMLFIYFFFHNINSFPRAQRGVMAIVILLISSVLLIVQARAAYEFFEAVLKERAELVTIGPEQNTNIPEPETQTDKETPAVEKGVISSTDPPYVPPQQKWDVSLESIAASAVQTTILEARPYRTTNEELAIAQIDVNLAQFAQVNLMNPLEDGFIVYDIDGIGYINFEQSTADHINTRWGPDVLGSIVMFADLAYRDRVQSDDEQQLQLLVNEAACLSAQKHKNDPNKIRDVSAGMVCVLTDMLSRPSSFLYQQVFQGVERCYSNILEDFAEIFQRGCVRYCKVDNTYEPIEFPGVPPSLGEPCEQADGDIGIVDIGGLRPKPPSFISIE